MGWTPKIAPILRLSWSGGGKFERWYRCALYNSVSRVDYAPSHEDSRGIVGALRLMTRLVMSSPHVNGHGEQVGRGQRYLCIFYGGKWLAAVSSVTCQGGPGTGTTASARTQCRSTFTTRREVRRDTGKVD